ncbi:hypothetical protein O6H91_19G048100 [Diphasiastrum complanatum]|uniref:Uncharacterized protein n=1 Tax=Diphasiastrum complanatum TaxID=34168 RepID=A0ACC2AUW9_DIPCM|nr:hypothetical protein O6H91_19G048100 [Diphasiastrum complanatum]
MKWFLFSDPERRVYNAKNAFRRPSWTAEHTSGKSSSDKSSQTSERSFGSVEADQFKCTSQQTKDLQVFTYEELEAATRKFTRGNLLGEGGFGSVFKGCIRPKRPRSGEGKLEVAVKQLNQKSLQGDKEWLAEINFLSYVDHPNLVKLVGYCSEDNERGMHRLLVYELVTNRSLDEHLFGRAQLVLSWKSRVQIALGAARGLDYLHEGIDVQIIFRDFKTSNVLLDKNFNPKLSDFGFARQGPAFDHSHVTTAAQFLNLHTQICLTSCSFSPEWIHWPAQGTQRPKRRGAAMALGW